MAIVVRNTTQSYNFCHRFVNNLVYYGVAFASPSLGGNMYFNFFLTSVVEAPANWASIYCIGR